VWSRWPSAGINDLFGSARAYHDTVREMVASETVLDTAMVYFDARLSQRYPTIEVRVADVCLHSEDAVLIAALVRALVDTAAKDWAAGREPDPVRTEVLNLAAWRAGRSGLAGELIDPTTRRPLPALAVLALALLVEPREHFVRPRAEPKLPSTRADVADHSLSKGCRAHRSGYPELTATDGR
jgi:carboxylate-amine ligase